MLRVDVNQWNGTESVEVTLKFIINWLFSTKTLRQLDGEKIHWKTSDTGTTGNPHAKINN
jgi:hypothetical protein